MDRDAGFGMMYIRRTMRERAPKRTAAMPIPATRFVATKKPRCHHGRGTYVSAASGLPGDEDEEEDASDGVASFEGSSCVVQWFQVSSQAPALVS